MDVNANIDCSTNGSGVKFYFNNKLLKFTKFEMFNFDILKNIFQNGCKQNLFVHPGSEGMYLALIMNAALTTYISNMIKPENNILNHLSIDDKVFFRGKITVYKGREAGKIKLLYGDNSTHMIPESKAYDLILYSGESKAKIMNDKKSKKEIITKEIIASLINIKADILLGTILDSSMIVLPNKKYIENLLENITIEYQEKKYPFTQIFPCSYVTNSCQYNNYRGNYARQEPLLKFTSNISTAYEIIREDKGIKNVFILDGECLRTANSDIELISKRKSIEKLIFVSRWTSVHFIYQNTAYEDLTVYAWTKEVLDKMLGSCSSLNDNTVHPIFRQQFHSLQNNINMSVKAISIDEPALDKLFKSAKSKLNSLKKINSRIQEVDLFILTAYGLLKFLETTIFSMSDLEDYIRLLNLDIKSPNERVRDLRKIKNTAAVSSDVKDLLNSILGDLVEIFDTLCDENPKLTSLKNIIKEYKKNNPLYKKNQKWILLVRKNFEADILNLCFNHILDMELDCECINRFTPQKKYDGILLTGWYENKRYNILNNPNFKDSTVLLYKGEKNRYNYYVHSMEQFNHFLKNKNRIPSLFNFNIFEEEKPFLEEFEENKDDSGSLSDESQLEEYMDELFFNINLSSSSYNQESKDCKMAEVEQMLVSSEYEYVMLTKKVSLYLIDYEKSRIRQCKKDSIKIGDNLLFINDYLSEERSLVLDVMEKLLEEGLLDSSISGHLELTKIWKEKLRRYIDIHALSVTAVCNQLSKLGSSYNQVTVRSWIYNNKIIGPRETEVFKNIAEIIEDDYIKINIDSIIYATEVVRKLHTKVRKKIDEVIVDKFFNKHNKQISKEYNVVFDFIGDVEKYTKVIEIHQMKDFERKVPMYLTNKVLHRDFDY